MSQKDRLVGIDLWKGIAAFAVVFIHSPNSIFGSNNLLTLKLGAFFNFAVPFFLVTSFYLSAYKYHSAHKNISIRARLKFLFIPYIVWSSIYLIMRTFKHFSTSDYSKIHELFSDPVALIFFGSSAVQLYFIPLLLVGTVVHKLVCYFVQRKSITIRQLFVFLIITTSIYNWSLYSGNDFQLDGGFAFTNIANLITPSLNSNYVFRLLFVFIAWSIRCLPYIIVAIIISKLNIDNPYIFKGRNKRILLSIIFILLNLQKSFGLTILPGFREISIALVSLILAINLSYIIKNNNQIHNLGMCSFGIYLIHHSIVELVQPVLSKYFLDISNSTILVLSCAIISFLASWLIVFFLRKNAKIRPILFGA